jgi:hypothetical protein
MFRVGAKNFSPLLRWRRWMVGQGMVLIFFVVIDFVEFAGFVCCLFYEVSISVDVDVDMEIFIIPIPF